VHQTPLASSESPDFRDFLLRRILVRTGLASSSVQGRVAYGLQARVDRLSYLRFKPLSGAATVSPHDLSKAVAGLPELIRMLSASDGS
jgi:hypothetical protein